MRRKKKHRKKKRNNNKKNLNHLIWIRNETYGSVSRERRGSEFTAT